MFFSLKSLGGLVGGRRIAIACMCICTSVSGQSSGFTEQNNQGFETPSATRQDDSTDQELEWPSVDSKLPNPTVTNQKLFSIPFYLNKRIDNPTSVQLYVSGNGGKKWSIYQRRKPSDGRFDFHAGVDGEYWFAVLSDRNSYVPDENTRPEKIVVVDTENPDLQLRLKEVANGQLQAIWNARDLNLNARTFRLSYLDEKNEWRNVRVILPQEKDSEFDGEVSWLAANASVTTVKAEILDLAGNNAVAEVHVDPTNTSKDAETQLESSADFNSFGALPTGSTPASQMGKLDNVSTMKWTSAERDKDDNASLMSIVDDPQIGLPPPRNHLTDHNKLNSANDDSANENHFLETSVEPNNVPVSNDNLLGNEDTSRRVMTDFDMAPSSKEPASQMFATNSRQFNLDYEIIDAESVARVELWITENNGRNWIPYGTDEDKVSPFLVEVEKEGRYGFQLLVHGTDGRSIRPPQNGDTPQITVEFDSSRPNAFLTFATFERNGQRGLLELDWSVSDANLSAKPITLSYSETLNGPWVIIAREVENTGRFQWQAPIEMPLSFFVQIDVEDKAGNRTVHRLPNPVSRSKPVPKATIRSLRSVD